MTKEVKKKNKCNIYIYKLKLENFTLFHTQITIKMQMKFKNKID